MDPASLIEHATMAVAGIDAEGVVTSMSGGISSITGLDPSAYTDRSWVGLCHPGDVPKVGATLGELLDAPDGTRRTVRCRMRGADAGWVGVEIESTRLLDHEAGLFVATVRGIADLDAQPDRAEAFLRSVIDAAADAMVVVDESWRVLWASPSASVMSGYTTAELQGMTVQEAVHPEDLSLLMVLGASLFDGTAAPGDSVECRLREADGSWRWKRLALADLRDVEGVEGVVVVIDDIHEAVEQRRAHEVSQRRFEALVRNSQDAVVVTLADGSCRFASPAITTILGWEPDRVAESPFGVGMPEPDRQRLAAAMDAARADPSRAQRVECRMPHAAGGHRWVELVLRDHSTEPEIGGLVCNLRDVTERRRLLGELEERNAFLASLAVSSSTALFEQDSVSGLVWANENWEEITGVSVEDSLGDRWRSLFEPGEAAPGELEGSLPGPESPTRLRLTRPDGEQRWLDLRSMVLPADDQGVVRRIGGIEDVTQVVESEAARGRLTAVFDATDDLVILAAPTGEVVYANRAAQEFLGPSVHDLADNPALAGVVRTVEEVVFVHGRSSWRGEVVLADTTGSEVPMSLEVLVHRDAEGDVEYFSTTARNITERIELEQSLERQARHDPLTGLPNRTLLYERIREASAAIAGDPGRWISVLFIDLDHFKIINDSLGHTLGDQLLQAISHRIRTVAGPGDVVGRFGGDEFVVLCENVSDPAHVLDLARRVETTLETPFRLWGHDIHVGVSIGVADAAGESDPDVILRDADTAMYEAKSSGRGRLVVFDDELRRRAVDRQRTESELRASRDGGDLEVFYQPVLDLRTRTVRGTEALLRWHRGGELVPPEDFVTVAEETGLIVPIGRWVLEEACKQTARWQQLPGWADLGISVNVSARQLQRPGFAGTVGDVLHASGLARGTLTLEITETVLVEDEATVVAVLEALRAMDVHLAIDDFGTGYSSLTYLHRLPVDTVKLDRSFVAGVADDLQKRAIVTAVMTLTKALGLRSIAEGVETERELAELRILGCTAGQGHLISPALEAGDIAPLLSGGQGRAGGPQQT